MKSITKTLVTAIALNFGISSICNAQKMYWTDIGSDKIQRADLDGSNLEDLVTTGLSQPEGIALDLTNSKMYWVDVVTDKIQRADLDGSNVEDLITTGLSATVGIALDLTNSKMYWTDLTTDKIQRADLDGSNVEDLITTGLSAPQGIELDLTNSKMYWIDRGIDKIQRAGLDGSNKEDLVTSANLDDPKDIALDITNSKMYWTDNGENNIKRANLDGSSIEVLLTGLSNPFGIELDLTNSKMYWIEANAKKVRRADLDGSNTEDLVSDLDIPQLLALGISDTPLSIELSSFNLFQIENTIQLKWVTVTESNNEGFNVYRKSSRTDFVQIASFKGNSELLGELNSTTSNTYTFTDKSEFRNNEFYTYFISDNETNGTEIKHENLAQTILFTFKEEIVKSKIDYILEQNFPNPFNPSTKINFQIAKEGKVTLRIFNLNGELINELVNDNLNEGSHSVNWNGTNSEGKSVSSGTYFYKLEAGTFTQTNKMILLK
ncbi:MAG: T9SS C-terminal target domain-containing protein [Calditrichaeota bacterium]|nr:MAG: T9SS C-terminal target domain-containing protein [Calditrichota bacterium]